MYTKLAQTDENEENEGKEEEIAGPTDVKQSQSWPFVGKQHNDAYTRRQRRNLRLIRSKKRELRALQLTWNLYHNESIKAITCYHRETCSSDGYVKLPFDIIHILAKFVGNVIVQYRVEKSIKEIQNFVLQNGKDPMCAPPEMQPFKEDKGTCGACDCVHCCAMLLRGLCCPCIAIGYIMSCGFCCHCHYCHDHD